MWTDILATAAGLVLVHQGVKHDNALVTGIGGAIIVEHFWQWYYNKA